MILDGFFLNSKCIINVRKATPNKFLDSRPDFVKSWCGWEV